MVAVSRPAASAAVLDRGRLEMMPGGDRESPRFVYHAARQLQLEPAERLIRQASERSSAKAKAALKAVVEELASREYEVVAAGIVAGNRPLTAPLEEVLGSHSLVHAAEGELFRGAIRSAVQALGIPVTDVRAKELHARAAATLGVTDAKVVQTLAEIGRVSGRPWAKDHKDACLAALIALLA